MWEAEGGLEERSERRTESIWKVGHPTASVKYIAVKLIPIGSNNTYPATDNALWLEPLGRSTWE